MMAHILGSVIQRLAFTCAFALAALSCARATTPLMGTDLGSGVAPDFTLTDGLTGASFSLSSLRGSVVAMAFLYTRCPDVCPLTAGMFRAAQRALGADAAKVEFLAVSVDPEGDTPAAVREFSSAHDLSEHWRYLVGARAQLQPVWALYGIGSIPDPERATVTHSDAIYLIDARGRERVLTHSDDPPDALLSDLRALLREG